MNYQERQALFEDAISSIAPSYGGFSAAEIRNAWEDSLAQGFTPEQIYQGAAAKFGLTPEQVKAALAQTQGVNVQQMFTTPTVQSNIGEINYDDLIAQIEARYGEGKTPDLAVKSALQLGIDPGVILSLPGVSLGEFAKGQALISSGAFSNIATGTSADTQQAAQPGTTQYTARIAAGLDPFGFPAKEVAKLTAQGLYGSGKKYDPGTSAVPQDTLASKIQQAVDFLNSPENLRMAEAAQTMTQVNVGGKTYNVYPDGLAQLFEDGRVKVFDPSGNLVLNQTQEEYARPGYLSPFVNAAKAALIGSVLGPAGLGLSTPVAAAGGAGLGNLASGGDLESALKAAALGGLTAYGAGELFGGTSVPLGETTGIELAAADDIAQLIALEIPPDQVAQIISQNYGIDLPTALSSVEAVSGSGGSFVAPTMEQSVIVPGQTTGNLGTLSSLAPALATFTPTQTLPSIEVTGQTIKPDLSVPETVAATLPAVLGGSTQQVNVTGTNIPSVEPATPAAAAVGAIIPGIQPTIPTAPEQVQVTGTKVTAPNITIPALSAVLPTIPTAVSATLPTPTQPTVKKEDSLFTPSDILKLLTLLGGTAAIGGVGTGTIPTSSIPPSDTMLGTTTPQFGPDYYAAVQRYYNAYMPETPRNVAGPLQQWYENKYGA